MLLAVLFLAQASAPGPVPTGQAGAQPGAEPQTPDFLRITPKGDCAGKDADEILVCGSRNRNERYRLRPLPPGYERKPPTAEFRLGDAASGSVYVEGVEIAPGVVSKRLMIGLKTKF